MLKWLTPIPVIIALALASCTGGTSSPQPGQVEAAIKQLCGIAVPLADIATLISQSSSAGGLGGTVASIDALAHLVCDAYTKQQSQVPQGVPHAAASGTLVVNGVLVHYQKA